MRRKRAVSGPRCRPCPAAPVRAIPWTNCSPTCARRSRPGSTPSLSTAPARPRLTYDPRHSVAYIRLREPSGPVETVCVSDELNVDLAPDGTIYGIELLDANKQLCADDGRIVLVDEEKGEERALALASEPRA
jgi:uncharacterized protein YuzE